MEQFWGQGKNTLLENECSQAEVTHIYTKYGGNALEELPPSIHSTFLQTNVILEVMRNWKQSRNYTDFLLKDASDNLSLSLFLKITSAILVLGITALVHKENTNTL